MSLPQPKVHAQDDDEDEVQDPHEEVKGKCESSTHCEKYKEKLTLCSEDSNRPHGENCEEEFFDFIHCVDHCVTKTLFSKLK